MKRSFARITVLIALLAPFAMAGQDGRGGGLARRADAPGAAIVTDLAEGRITEGEAALYKAQALFGRPELPDRYRGKITDLPKVEATTRILDILKHWQDLPQRGRDLFPPHLRPGARRDRILVPKGSMAPGSVMPAAADKTPLGDDSEAPPYQFTYTTTNFQIHYSTTGEHRLIQGADGNSNGIPDMVESAGAFLETTWTWFINKGYRLPPGTDVYYYNVYFENLSAMGAWGYCAWIDWPDRHSRSFISLTSDFSGAHLPDWTPIAPVEAMRTTASHELMHACQFAYDTLEDAWWMEATAVWVQDQIGPAWDAVNDYVGWVKEFLYYPETSLDSDFFYRWYEDVVWAIFLHTHVDPDGSIIREIWEGCEGSTNAMAATRSVLWGYLSGGFAEAWRDFLVANYKADYPEASQFPAEYRNLWYNDNLFTYPTGTRSPGAYLPEGLGSNYIRFYQSGAAGYDLSVLFMGYASTNWAAMLVGRAGSSYTRIDTASGATAVLGGFTSNFTEAVLIVSPTVENNYGGYFFTYSGVLTLGDSQAPTPNPLTFAVNPHGVSPTSIAMNAYTATDAASPPVEYQFHETTGGPGGSDRDWGTSSDFTDSSLAVNMQYGYRVRARDSAPSPNTTSWSAEHRVYTLCNTPGAPSLHDPSPTKLYITLSGADANPAQSLYTVYNATAASYVSGSGQSSPSPYWATRDQWNSIRVLNLNPSTTYSFLVKARNGDAVETAFSAVGQGTTLAADTAAPTVANIAIVPTWVKELLTNSVTVTATASDLSTGGSDIVGAEFFVGSDPGQGAGTPMAPGDGAFNSPAESAAAALVTTGWTNAASPYHLYVRARDETGRWSTPVHYAIEVVDGIPPVAVTDLSAMPAPPGVEEPASLTVSSVSSESPGGEAARAVDGSLLTKWASEPRTEASHETIVFDLDAEAVVGKITLHTSARADLFPGAFKIKLSDGDDWWTVVSETDCIADPGANTWRFGARTATQLRIDILATPFDAMSGYYRTEIAEIDLFRDVSGTRIMNLSWSAPADTGPTGRAALYVVKWSTDMAALAASFSGNVPDDDPPVPAAPGAPQGMTVKGLEPGTLCYFAVKSTDDYDNWSAVSSIAAASTLPDPSPYVALDGPQDERDLDVPTPPTFAWHANIYDAFKINFSNVPTFPARPYKDAMNRVARTIKFGVKRRQTTFTPSKAQWKAIKRLGSSMDGTLYWRVEGRSSQNRSIGVGYSEVFSQYGFESGTFSGLQFGPYHDKEGTPAVWPDNRPQFVWNVTNPLYRKFFLDFAVTPEINIYDRKNTYSMPSKNGPSPWCRPSPAQWKQIKRRFANVNAGRIYWRVRGLDNDLAFSAVSDSALLLIDSPTFHLREPSPRRDGTVHPEEPFTLEWGINAEGYNGFRPQISVFEDFPKGPQTMNLRKVRNRFTCPVTRGQVRRLVRMLEDAGADTFYWRVIASDVDNTMSIESGAESVEVSEQPAGGGA